MAVGSRSCTAPYPVSAALAQQHEQSGPECKGVKAEKGALCVSSHEGSEAKRTFKSPPSQVDSADDPKQTANTETTGLQGTCPPARAEQQAPGRQPLVLGLRFRAHGFGFPPSFVQDILAVAFWEQRLRHTTPQYLATIGLATPRHATPHNSTPHNTSTSLELCTAKF